LTATVDLYRIYTNIGWAMVIIIAAIMIWYFYSFFYALPDYGRPLGRYSVWGRTTTKNHVILSGQLVDCTDRFLAIEVERLFRALCQNAVHEVARFMPRNTEEYQRFYALSLFLKDEKNNLRNFVKINAIRSIDRRIHYLIQWGHVQKSLEGYATFSKRPSWDWQGPGFIVRGVIGGEIRTVPPNIQATWAGSGMFKRRSVLHLFLPDDWERAPIIIPPLQLAEAVVIASPWAKSELESRVLRRRVQQSEQRVVQATKESLIKSRMFDSISMMVKDLGITDQLSVFKKTSEYDFVIMIVAITLSVYVAQYLKLEPFLGALAGAIFSLLFMKRKG